MRNPLSFTARTFNTIYYDLKAKYPDKPEWFIVMLCGLFDVAHWYIDAQANNAILASAYTPEAVDNLLAYIDYYRAGSQASSGDIAVTLEAGTPLPHTVSRENLKASIVKPDKQALNVEAISAHTFNALTENVTFYDGETLSVSLGESDGTTKWQTFAMPRENFIPGTGSLIINGQPWAEVDFLIESGPTDKVYRVIRFPDGFSRVRFGDGITGAIPDAGYPIQFEGRYGGGLAGNFLTANATAFYSGADAAVESLAFSSAQFSGGANEETIDNARFIAPQLLKVNERAVTERDYELLSLRFSNGIARAKCLPGYYGSGTVGVHIIPTGGGLPSAGLKSALQAYLIPRTPLSLVDVRVRDPNYVTQNITVGLKMRPGTNFAVAQGYAEVFTGLLVAEFAKEVVDTYLSTGIAEAIALINSYFGKSYGASNYAALVPFFDILADDNVSDWGTPLTPGNVFQVTESIPNVQFSTVSIPAAQVNIDPDKTFTKGVITVTQIP